MIETETADGWADANGDDRLARLFDTHYHRLYRLARRLSGSGDGAADLVQDTFVRIARSSRQVPFGSVNEEAWLVQVLVNLSRDRWRRRQVRAANLPEPAAPADPTPAYQARLAVQAALGHLLALAPPC